MDFDNQQIFSNENDVLPEGKPIGPLKIGCLAFLAYKLGCMLIGLVVIALGILLFKLDLLPK